MSVLAYNRQYKGGVPLRDTYHDHELELQMGELLDGFGAEIKRRLYDGSRYFGSLSASVRMSSEACSSPAFLRQRACAHRARAAALTSFACTWIWLTI